MGASSCSKIVFINQATGYLTIDIINEFVKYADKVALITGSIRVQDIILDQNVEVSYTVKYNRGNVLLKALSWLIGTVQIQLKLYLKYKDYERFYFTIPPTSYILALNLKSRYSLLIYDLYPDAFLSFGLSNRSFLYRRWAQTNSRVFNSAYKVFTISEKMKQGIQQYSIRNVDVIPNWSAFFALQIVPREKNVLIRELNLNEKFIVQYSGNIGMTHDLEVLIKVAELFENSSDIQFLIIGRGKRMDSINKLINQKKLKNCMVLPFRKDEQLFDSLCAADVAVITLDDKSTDISIPSKTYNIMAAGVPIMAIASEHSEIASILKYYHNGKTFVRTDFNGMYQYIYRLMNDPVYRKSLSDNSQSASRDFTRLNAKKYCTTYLNKNL